MLDRFRTSVTSDPFGTGQKMSRIYYIIHHTFWSMRRGVFTLVTLEFCHLILEIDFCGGKSSGYRTRTRTWFTIHASTRRQVASLKLLVKNRNPALNQNNWKMERLPPNRRRRKVSPDRRKRVIRAYAESFVAEESVWSNVVTTGVMHAISGASSVQDKILAQHVKRQDEDASFHHPQRRKLQYPERRTKTYEQMKAFCKNAWL